MRVFFTLICVLSSSAAMSQTTTCRQLGGEVRCTTDQGHAPINQGTILQSGRNLVPDYAEEQRKSQENDLRRRLLRSQLESQNLRASMGKLITAGRCDDALKMALEEGNFDLAERAKAFCARQ